MRGDMHIRHLKHCDIDRARWDRCIRSSPDGLPYAMSWYLDAVSPGWEALVAGDYECVMPLPRRRKYGVSYLVQPPLTQQLGVFSTGRVGEALVEEFVRRIPYRSYHLALNEGNALACAAARPNYVLDLRSSYEDLRGAYSKNTRRNIVKAASAGVCVENELSVEEFTGFYFAEEKPYVVPGRELVTRFFDSARAADALVLCGARSGDVLVAVVALLVACGRVIFLLPCSNDEGKRSSAMFVVVDDLIRRHASTPCLLDFEGSRVEGVARFYRGFGAESRPYFEVKKWSVNDLMLRLRMMRKAK